MYVSCESMKEKRYQCDGCHRSYKHQSNLCNHKREECGKSPSYFCPVCRKGFKKKQHMQRHAMSIHGVFIDSASNLTKANRNALSSSTQNLYNLQNFARVPLSFNNTHPPLKLESELLPENIDIDYVIWYSWVC